MDPRFQLLTYVEKSVCRFRIFPPDLVELRWSVFDNNLKRTIAYGRTAAEAADAAIERVGELFIS